MDGPATVINFIWVKRSMLTEKCIISPDGCGGSIAVPGFLRWKVENEHTLTLVYVLRPIG
jgi:hypothetical protein